MKVFLLVIFDNEDYLVLLEGNKNYYNINVLILHIPLKYFSLGPKLAFSPLHYCEYSDWLLINSSCKICNIKKKLFCNTGQLKSRIPPIPHGEISIHNIFNPFY